ncbi:MAG: hypothetical protein KGH96_04005 [Sphingomonadales bacterium]|nr:hypothetical protein [Sphingomonadales bacterium]
MIVSFFSLFGAASCPHNEPDPSLFNQNSRIAMDAALHLTQDLESLA